MEIIVAEYLRGPLRSRVSFFLFMRDPSLSRIDKFLLAKRFANFSDFIWYITHQIRSDIFRKKRFLYLTCLASNVSLQKEDRSKEMFDLFRSLCTYNGHRNLLL